MMTFWAVLLAILAANVIWTVGIFMIMRSKKIQLKMIDWYVKYIEWFTEKFEERL